MLPLGSVFGVLPFDIYINIYIYIYINDIFCITECDDAGDTTFHTCDSDPRSLINSLEHD